MFKCMAWPEYKRWLDNCALPSIVGKTAPRQAGDEALRFAPAVSLGDTERRDWATDATAAVALSPEITDSQWNSVTEQLGLPAALPGEQPRGMARQQQIAEQRVQTPAPQGRITFRPRSGAFVTIKARRVT
jgi:hypothetical protein